MLGMRGFQSASYPQSATSIDPDFRRDKSLAASRLSCASPVVSASRTAINHRMYLAGQTGSRPAHGLPFIAGDASGVLMNAHNGRVDHLDGRIMGGSKRLHDPTPYSSSSPTDEAVVAGGARTVATRQIAPRCAGLQDPKDTVEHTLVVFARYAPGLIRKKRLDGCPFIVAELIMHDSRLPVGPLELRLRSRSQLNLGFNSSSFSGRYRGEADMPKMGKCSE